MTRRAFSLPEPCAKRIHPIFIEPVLADGLGPMDEISADADRHHVRRITDSDARQWVIREKVMSYDRRSQRVLVFENEQVIRVVRAFPAEWFTLGVAELMELSEQV